MFLGRIWSLSSATAEHPHSDPVGKFGLANRNYSTIPATAKYHCVLELRPRCLLRNPTPIAALAFEHVKPSRYRRVQHGREILRLFPAFETQRGNGIFRGTGLFHAAQNAEKILRAIRKCA